jgi:GT2 family glycosyltransferase
VWKGTSKELGILVSTGSNSTSASTLLCCSESLLNGVGENLAPRGRRAAPGLCASIELPLETWCYRAVENTRDCLKKVNKRVVEEDVLSGGGKGVSEPLRGLVCNATAVLFAACGTAGDMNSRRTPKLPMIEELLSYDNERFLQCAYYMILGRKPDNEGWRVYMKHLRAGVSKSNIITILAKSPEGKSTGVSSVALEVLLTIHKIMNWPVLDALLRRLWKETPKPAFPDFFDPIWYLQEYPDVVKAYISPYYHYVNYGMKEGRCPAFDRDWYLAEYPDVVASGYNPRDHYDKYGRAQKRHPWFGADWYLTENPDVACSGMNAHGHYIRIGKEEGRQAAYSVHNDYRRWLVTFDILSTEMRAEMYARTSRFAQKPLISIVMPVCGVSPTLLRETLNSVTSQIYQEWELCVAHDLQMDEATRSILERYALEDNRIRINCCNANGSMVAVKNCALGLVTGKWITLLEPNDLLADSALYWIIDAINRVPDIGMIYSDADKINGRGIRIDPSFKCDWNPDLFYSYDIFAHLGVYLTSLVKNVSGFRGDLEGAEDYDLTLRCLELLHRKQIHHIPRVLYHCRTHAENTRSTDTASSSAQFAGIKALNEHLARLGVNAKAASTPDGFRVRYSLPDPPPLISLIIPTRNGLQLLRNCVSSITDKTSYKPFEILIIDNGSDDPETLLYLKNIGSREGVRVIRDDRAFNYSALNNAAVKLARGAIIGLINNDIEVIGSDWLSEMASHAIRPEVAAVGARLWYPDDTLQHGGIILGGGNAWHAHRNIAKNDPGYMARATNIQSISAVTGACLIVRKSIYEELGGLNEADLQVTFNDVDFCLRALKAGYRNIWTPYAELYHHESATRGSDDAPAKQARVRRELEYMQTHWATELTNDPAYSPNLTNECEDFSLAWPPRLDHHRMHPGLSVQVQ